MSPTKRTRLSRSSKARKSRQDDNPTNFSTSHLKWNLQSERILSQLISLYHGGGGSGEDGSSSLLTDVTLFSSDGQCIPAHKIILTLSSPFFHKLFTQISSSQSDRIKNGSPAVIFLGNVNSSHLRNLIRLIYTSQCIIPSNQLEEFHQIALQFGVEGLLTSSSKSQSQHSQPQTTTNSDVIKVHIIDQRRQPEQDNHLSNDSSIDESPPPSRIPPCKTEPSDPGGDDDHLSNFSDDLSHQGGDDGDNDDDPSTNYVPPKTKPRPRPSPRKSVHTWLKLDPPPTLPQLKSDWRVSSRLKYATFTGHQYYCAQGYRQSCPAEIKSKTLHDGTIFWFKNDKLHDNHKPADYQFGLTDKQKDFVVGCLESGVVMPKDIFLKMELAGIEKPSRIKLAGMLQRYRKKNPDKVWKRVPPSLSRGATRRIRKFSKKPPPSRGEGGNAPPRKRGRPLLAKTSTPSTTTTIPPNIPSTLSTSTSQCTEGNNIYTSCHHPNHYPSSQVAGLPFPPFVNSSLQNTTASSTLTSYPFQNF